MLQQYPLQGIKAKGKKTLIAQNANYSNYTIWACSDFALTQCCIPSTSSWQHLSQIYSQKNPLSILKLPFILFRKSAAIQHCVYIWWGLIELNPYVEAISIFIVTIVQIICQGSKRLNAPSVSWYFELEKSGTWRKKQENFLLMNQHFATNWGNEFKNLKCRSNDFPPDGVTEGRTLTQHDNSC